MKKISLIYPAVILVAIVTLTSCSTRVYGPPPPPPRASVSLILNAGPGMMINRYSDGRYYYRAPNGYMYWRGYNNRYYLDQRYISPYHRHNQYNEWRRNYRRR